MTQVSPDDACLKLLLIVTDVNFGDHFGKTPEILSCILQMASPKRKRRKHKPWDYPQWKGISPFKIKFHLKIKNFRFWFCQLLWRVRTTVCVHIPGEKVWVEYPPTTTPQWIFIQEMLNKSRKKVHNSLKDYSEDFQNHQ